MTASFLSTDNPLDLSLEAQVAQRFIVGYQPTAGGTIPQRLQDFINVGLGGIIFFRPNFDALQPQQAWSVVQLLNHLVSAYPQSITVYPFLSIDQEGGQIERLSRQLFPSLVSPMSVGLKTLETDNGTYCAEVYDMLSFYMHQLGFNLNFTPTLDVNLDPNNPIIGVRAFGEDPDLVWRCGQIVLERLGARNIVGVAKHFPGHGDGSVDSHLTLPMLNYSDNSLKPFQQAIEFGVPAIMVSHGYYPALQATKEPENTPASLSKVVIQDLLRNQLGYNGLVMSDDLCMGAITERLDPVEAAIQAIEAGIDILIYKDSDEAQWRVFEGLVAALQSGRLDRKAHEAAVSRILKTKATLQPVYPLQNQAIGPKQTLIEALFSKNALEANSELMASQSVSLLMDDETIPLPLTGEQPIGLVYPDGSTIHHYANETHLPDLATLFEAQRITVAFSQVYQPTVYSPLRTTDTDATSPATIIYVTYDLHRDPTQIKRFEELKAEYPESPIMLVSANTPYEWQAIDSYAMHLALCSYRYQSQQALVHYLTVPSAED